MKYLGKTADKISHLFFSDNTLVFCLPDDVYLLDLHCILLCFQAVSDLNINLAKPKLVRLGEGSISDRLAKIIGCKEVKLLMKYLEMPLGAIYKDVRTWHPIVAMIERRLSRWKRSLLSKERGWLL